MSSTAITETEITKTFAFFATSPRTDDPFCKIRATNPQGPPNFLRAAALGEYKKPVVVMPGSEEVNEEEEVEPPPEREPRESLQIPQVRQRSIQEIDHMPPPLPPSSPSASFTFRFSPRQYYMLSQMGAPDIPSEPRETENDQLKRELGALKPELQLIKSEVSPSSAYTNTVFFNHWCTVR